MPAMDWRALVVGSVVASNAARAQEELEVGSGLDLTEPATEPEYRPALAILGVVAGPAVPEEAPVLEARAEGVNITLLPAAMQGEPFSRGMSPDDSKAALGAEYEAAQKCA